jgi:hypothetical protein
MLSPGTVSQKLAHASQRMMLRVMDLRAAYLGLDR